MQYLTALVLGLFVAYIGAWFTGAIHGNMALLLFVATFVTGIYWLAEKFWFLPKRRAALAQMEATAANHLSADLEPGVDGEIALRSATLENDEVREQRRRHMLAQPWWLDWTAGLFPVIALVFVLRSFAFEPFKIPSGSMLPTLEVGDLILVNKWTWGLRIPVLNAKITQGSPVQRGDVMVFRYPPEPQVDYIKRVVGLPGDTVSYLNKKLTINGKEVEKIPAADYQGEREEMDPGAGEVTRSPAQLKQYQELLGAHQHHILNDPERPAGVSMVADYPLRENCSYSPEGVTCKVPPGYYFVMGDNRDNSLDSRFWGFVPDGNIVGRAVAVWMNFGNFGRIGGID
ncbi:MAG: signal peptidase I [Brachymonas sp.]|nr:signal peptidase I [Brachymonas sp.]